MQTFTLARVAHTACSTHGKLLSPDGAWLAEVLERGPSNPDGHPRIPAGTYVVDVRSPPFQSHFDVTLKDPRWLGERYRGILWLPNVPSRTNIELHPANWYTDLRGCIAFGLESGADQRDEFMVTASRQAYAKVYPLILAAITGGGAQLHIVDEAAS